MPQSPWMKVHACFRKECGRVQVVGELFHRVAHGVAVSLRGQAMVSRRVGWKAKRHCSNVSFFTGRCVGCEFARFGNGFMRLLVTVRVSRIVVVWSHGFRQPPIGHCQFWIEYSGTLKRSRCFFVVEGIDQAHSLVEKFLRLRVVGGDGMVQISQPGHQGGFLGGGLAVRRVLLGGDGTGKHKRYQDADRELHGSFSSILGCGPWIPEILHPLEMAIRRDLGMSELLLLAEYLTQQSRRLCRGILANLPLLFT